MGHNISGLFIVKFKDIGDHFRFIGLDDPLLMALVDHGHDVFLGHAVRIFTGTDTEQTRKNRRYAAHQTDQRIKQQR